MAGTLQEKDGYLFIVHEFPDWERPVLVRSWYPLGRRVRSWESFPVGQEMRECSDGLYMGAEDGLRYRLPQGGQTRPEFTEEEEIPRPRARKTRYQNGRWEKYLKGRGWVPA